MFKKDYSWVNDYIESALNNGHPLTYEAFKILKEDIERLQDENIKLKKELSKYVKGKTETKGTNQQKL